MTCFALSTPAQDDCREGVNGRQPVGSFTYTWLNALLTTSIPKTLRYDFTVDASTAADNSTVGTLGVKTEIDQRILLQPEYVEGDRMIIESPSDAPFRFANLTRVRDTTADSNILTHDITADLQINGMLTENRYELVVEYGATFTNVRGLNDRCFIFTQVRVIINVENPVVPNSAPAFDPPTPRVLTVDHGTAANMNIGVPITATDPDGDTLTYSATPTRSDLWDVDATTGQFSTQAVIPNQTITDRFHLTATYPDGATASIGVTITVNTPANQAPVFGLPDPRVLRVESGTAAGTDIGLPITATDPDGDTLTYSANPGRSDLWDVDASTGQFTTQAVMPDAAITETFQLTASDGNGGTASIGVRITLFRTPTDPDPKPMPQPQQTLQLASLCETVTYSPQRFGTSTPHVFISAIEVQIDEGNRRTGRGIYSPVAIEIYVSPEEEYLDLNGWKLELGIPYTPHKAYPLTTENSEIVDNVVRIINEDVEGGIPMIDSGFAGTEMPAFSFRLSDPQGRHVDLTFSCYYQGNVFQKLSEMENPRLERLILGTPGRAVKPEDYSFQYGLLSQWHPANNPLGSALAAPPARRPGKTAAIWAEFRKQ